MMWIIQNYFSAAHGYKMDMFRLTDTPSPPPLALLKVTHKTLTIILYHSTTQVDAGTE